MNNEYDEAKDAARYRWLREHFRDAPWDGKYDYGFISPEEVDEAIDAARLEAQPK